MLFQTKPPPPGRDKGRVSECIDEKEEDASKLDKDDVDTFKEHIDIDDDETLTCAKVVVDEKGRNVEEF
jgi:hypothetical protein